MQNVKKCGIICQDDESGRQSTLKFLNKILEIVMAKNIAATVKELISPTVAELGYILWDVEFVREGATNILRITIDTEHGIGIEDCEKVHRAVDPLLDETDPIEQAYNLEVSSPGLSRSIKNAEQAELCIGMPVGAKLYAPDDAGRRALNGVLKQYGDGSLTIETADGEAVTELKKIAKLWVCDDE